MNSNLSFLLKLFLIVMLLFLSFAYVILPDDSTIYFNDSSADLIVIGNTLYWETGFRKADGAIAYILNKQTGSIISYGNREGSLWKAEFPNNSGYVLSKSWNSGGFSYSWSEADKKLSLVYQSDLSKVKGADCTVTVTASVDDWLDLNLSLTVNGASNVVKYIHFPSDLTFAVNEIDEALYPSMPGLLLNKTFFLIKNECETTYPGYPGMFADFFWISTTGGSLAIYSVGNNDPLIPLNIGLGFSSSGGTNFTYWLHKYGAWKWQGQNFNSPSVRIRIGETKSGAAGAYRTDNGLDKYDSIETKLGDLYSTVAASLEMKLDATVLNLPFDQYQEKVFPKIPVPSILHFAGIQPGGFDENTPDFLPPNPKYGTTDTFRSMVLSAKKSGFLSMPYTNPTWWDNESPTVRNLPSPQTVKDISVVTEKGKPLFESYNGRGGYTVCPWAAYVIERIAGLHSQMKDEASSDLIFEDQIGARSWWFDFNDSASSLTSYIDGWIAHTRRYKSHLLTTEQGFDRLAETETGFYGSVLYLAKTGEAWNFWEAGTWEPYPLAPMMMRDKVLFYQHDLSDETFTSSKANLIWNIAFGYQLNNKITNSSMDDTDWLEMISSFQRDVLSDYAGELLTGFEYSDADFSKTVFQNYTVYTNWSAQSGRGVGSHTLSPEGFIVLSNDGNVNAGVFAGYNGLALSSGDHFIIEKRRSNLITVKQPLGNDTSIRIAKPSDWKTTDRINVFTYLNSRKSFVKIQSSVDENYINFNLTSQYEGEDVDIFLIINYH